MEISKDKMVSLTYELRVNEEQGKVVEVVEQEKPLVFLYGNGQMLPLFESKLDGLATGEAFKFKIESKDAYGEVNEGAVVDLPKNIFEVEGKIDDNILKIDNVIPMQDTNGNKLQGIVKEIKDETVKMDFNHPLAGDDLYFSGKIIEVREATKEELEQHNHECTNCGKH